MDKELEMLREVLNPAQLLFAHDYVKHYTDIAKGVVTVAELYSKAYPECKGHDTTRTNAWRLLNSVESVRRYVELLLLRTDKTNAPKLRTLDETRADLEKLATANMTELMTWRIAEGPNGERIPIPLLMDFEDVPDEVRRLIKSVTFTKNGPKLELHDQLKAQDMLNRMNGAYVDKVELSGPGGGAINVTLSGEVTTIIRKLLDDI